MRSRKLYTSVLMVIGLSAALPLTASLRSGTQEIRLVAKDMAFYLAGDTATPNPTIRVKPGKQVRILLENQDRGIVHVFAIDGLRLSIPPLKGEASASLLFRAPQRTGRYAYKCSPHARMMNGIFEVK